jgi:hypothetical protein
MSMSIANGGVYFKAESAMKLDFHSPTEMGSMPSRAFLIAGPHR